LAAVCEVDLREADIGSIVWATGFGGRFDYLDPALRDANGRPRHRGGIGEVPGLYCLGLTWLRRRGSGLIAGVARRRGARGRAHRGAQRGGPAPTAGFSAEQ